MTVESLIASLIASVFGGGVAGYMAKILLARSLNDLDEAIDKINEINSQLTGISVKLAAHEEDRKKISEHETQIAVLKTIMLTKKGAGKKEQCNA